jgi:hypothetical protein
MKLREINMAQETFEEYDLKEWKLIYLMLHKSTSNNWNVMDLEFFNDLQKYLQGKSEKIGLDPLDHDTWINWLNNVKNTPSPSASILDREVLPVSYSKTRKLNKEIRKKNQSTRAV